jgi:hypothetical protein
MGPGRGGVELVGGRPSSSSGHPRPMIRLLRPPWIRLCRTVLSSTGDAGDSRGVAGAVRAGLIEIFLLGDDRFDFDADLVRTGWDG